MLTQLFLLLQPLIPQAKALETPLNLALLTPNGPKPLQHPFRAHEKAIAPYYKPHLRLESDWIAAGPGPTTQATEAKRCAARGGFVPFIRTF